MNPQRHQLRALRGWLALLLVLLIACSREPTARPPSAVTPDSRAESTPLSSLGAVTTAPPPPAGRFAFGDSVPEALRSFIVETLKPYNFRLAERTETAELSITSAQVPNAWLFAEQVFVPVAALNSLRETTTLAAVRDLWQGKAVGGVSALYVRDDDSTTLSKILGAPSPALKRIKPELLTARLWDEPRAIALLPFDQLTPQLSALKLDGLNALGREVPSSRYPLVARAWLTGDAQKIRALTDALGTPLPITNRESARITTLVMTGVTAMTRVSAYRIEERRDSALPARLVAPTLAGADLLHVSNEVSFVDNC